MKSGCYGHSGSVEIPASPQPPPALEAPSAQQAGEDAARDRIARRASGRPAATMSIRSVEPAVTGRSKLRALLAVRRALRRILGEHVGGAFQIVERPGLVEDDVAQDTGVVDHAVRRRDS